MKHIILIGPKYYNYSEGIMESLVRLGFDVDFFPSLEFYENCSWLQRKFYKLGYKSLKQKWNNAWEMKLRAFINSHVQKGTIFLFCTGSMISTQLLTDLHAYTKVLYMWDSVKRYSVDFQKRIGLYDCAFAFEYSDIAYVKEKFGASMIYMPLGYDEKIFFPNENVVKDIDVSFIGSPTAERLDLLEVVASVMCKNRRLYTGGEWYKGRRKKSFFKKYPHLYQCHNNRNLDKEEVANIYGRSKIVLNINNAIHKSVSPRTFEIMATSTFQIMNRGQNFYPLNINFADDMDFYDDPSDLLNKIEFYLENDEIRIYKARNGYNKIVGEYSQTEILKKILSNII